MKIKEKQNKIQGQLAMERKERGKQLKKRGKELEREGKTQIEKKKQ